MLSQSNGMAGRLHLAALGQCERSLTMGGNDDLAKKTVLKLLEKHMEKRCVLTQDHSVSNQHLQASNKKIQELVKLERSCALHWQQGSGWVRLRLPA